MLTGTIKSFSSEKGFGFIVAPNGDLFFHISQCDPNHEPQIGDQVSFTLEENPRTGKLQAANVRLAYSTPFYSEKKTITINNQPCLRCGHQKTLYVSLQGDTSLSNWKCDRCFVVNGIVVGKLGNVYNAVHFYAVKYHRTILNKFGEHIDDGQKWLSLEQCSESGDPTNEIKDIMERRRLIDRYNPHLTKILHIVSLSKEAFENAGLNPRTEGWGYTDLW